MPEGRHPQRPTLTRKYTVEYIPAANPRIRRGTRSPWREALPRADQETARRSAAALRDMQLRFRIRVTFTDADAEVKTVKECTAAVWDRLGRVEYRHEGEMSDLIPGWAIGADPLEIPKDEEGEDRELVVPG